MNSLLKPVVALALGVVIGAVGFWLAAKPDVNIAGNSLPDVQGTSGATFASLDNPAVTDVKVNVGLDGYIATITGKVVIVGSRDNPNQIGVVVDDETIISAVKSGSGEGRDITFAELRPGDNINVVGIVEGSAIVARSISKVE